MVDPDPHAEAGSKSPQKSTRALRTISEVSRELDLPQHVLRFWETRFPQIKPVKRTGGRRYYRPEDVDVLRRIQHLLHESGFTVKGARKLLMEEQGRDRAASTVSMSGTLPDKTRGLLGDIRDELERLRHKLEAGLNG